MTTEKNNKSNSNS